MDRLKGNYWLLLIAPLQDVLILQISSVIQVERSLPFVFLCPVLFVMFYQLDKRECRMSLGSLQHTFTHPFEKTKFYQPIQL